MPSIKFFGNKLRLEANANKSKSTNWLHSQQQCNALDIDQPNRNEFHATAWESIEQRIFQVYWTRLDASNKYKNKNALAYYN